MANAESRNLQRSLPVESLPVETGLTHKVRACYAPLSLDGACVSWSAQVCSGTIPLELDQHTTNFEKIEPCMGSCDCGAPGRPRKQRAQVGEASCLLSPYELNDRSTPPHCGILGRCHGERRGSLSLNIRYSVQGIHLYLRSLSLKREAKNTLSARCLDRCLATLCC